MNSSSKTLTIRSIFFLLPSWLLLLIFFIGPILLTFYFSFTNLALTGAQAQQMQFVGFDNFVMMFQDANFRISVVKTILFLLLSAIIGQQLLGFLLAFLMKEKNTTFRRIIGIIIIAGWVTPEIVVAFCWVAFLNDNGTLNAIIQALGMNGVTWLYTFPLISVCIANIWHGTAFSMLVFQASLDDVPKSIEEAAKIDGASKLQILFRLIIPIVKGSIVTNMILVTLQTLGVFTLIYAMTGGGPGTATQTLPIFMYNQAFVNYQLGYGTAISLVLLLIGVVASLFYIRSMKVQL
ncbi:carbohydrate ABC transporter permease [Gracilibacillus salinarum]|uniref:Sugar ABC transporter permease n=1 Tax=Gracilibacillus salinarum TaxID=2932255 RepID=A0ABY4GQY8_9BACI|nr:sugar ABC transporter permease [Gracilibacillus salinarum]UOQ86816.1 sugar ABC transporter permease [Gracilibacillus salinarum]